MSLDREQEYTDSEKSSFGDDAEHWSTRIAWDEEEIICLRTASDNKDSEESYSSEAEANLSDSAGPDDQWIEPSEPDYAEISGSELLQEIQKDCGPVLECFSDFFKHEDACKRCRFLKIGSVLMSNLSF